MVSIDRINLLPPPPLFLRIILLFSNWRQQDKAKYLKIGNETKGVDK